MHKTSYFPLGQTDTSLFFSSENLLMTIFKFRDFEVEYHNFKQTLNNTLQLVLKRFSSLLVTDRHNDCSLGKNTYCTGRQLDRQTNDESVYSSIFFFFAACITFLEFFFQ